MKFISIIVIIMFFSCNGTADKVSGVSQTSDADNTLHVADTSDKKKTIVADKDTADVMLAADIRFNGKLKRFFNINEFEKVFGKPDSVKLLAEEAPCITIFDTEAPDDKYLYKSGSRFETSKDSVAVDEFWFRDGNFITYKDVRIDAHTTMQEVQQLFPDAAIGKLNEYREGELCVIQLKEDVKGISDGHIKVFFKNNKVCFMHWWFPC